MDPVTAAPRIGWVQDPSPVTELPGLGERAGMAWLGVKRDDLLPALHGGTKVRKLDRLLADPAWVRQKRWIGSGGFGSGQLTCLAAAAEELGATLEAHCFWQTPNPHALENLAFTAPRADLHYHRSRVTMALSAPKVLGHGPGVVPPGATTKVAMLGIVDAGRELVAQVRAGVCPEPDVVVVPLGSCGTAVGLAAGLYGLKTEVLAVATVEWIFAPAVRVRMLQRELGLPAVPLRISRKQVGRGYTIPTPAGLQAVALLAGEGIGLEPVYGGKAFAALLAEVPKGKQVLYWHTARRGPLPIEANWRDHLPAALRARLEAGEGPSRRKLIAAGAAVATVGVIAARTRGYHHYPAWNGAVLQAWEAEVLRAVAEAVLPPAPLTAAQLDALPQRVDAFLTAMTPESRLEVHALFGLIEQATAIDGDLSRFTRLTPEDRLSFLRRLESLGALPSVASRGIRDMAMLAYYQDPVTWAALGYGGPLVSGERAPSPYDALSAPRGVAP